MVSHQGQWTDNMLCFEVVKIHSGKRATRLPYTEHEQGLHRQLEYTSYTTLKFMREPKHQHFVLLQAHHPAAYQSVSDWPQTRIS